MLEGGRRVCCSSIYALSFVIRDLRLSECVLCEACECICALKRLASSKALISTQQTCDAGPQGQVCYYSGPQDALYERLGHAEVVQVELDGSKAKQEMEKYADVSLHLQSRWI